MFGVLLSWTTSAKTDRNQPWKPQIILPKISRWLMAGERNNTHITWSNWSLVLKTDACIHSAVVRAGLMHAGICTHTHTKRFSGVGISHEPRLSESTDIHAATQHKTNPSSDDDNRTHHWAIEQKGPDRGVDAVPVAERRRHLNRTAKLKL